MQDFPIEKVVYSKSILSGNAGDVSIEIFLSRFELESDGYTESVQTSIRLEGINIPNNPDELEGRKYVFPVNPTDGYIDGSIYFFSAHNPVDVTSIKFGMKSPNSLSMVLSTHWLLEHENTGFKNVNVKVRTEIEF